MTRQTRSVRHAGAVLATVGALALAACAPPPAISRGGAARTDGASALPECPLDALDAAEGKVEITLWYGGLVMPTSGVLVDLIADFNASQDKIEITGADQGVDYDETLRAFDRVISDPARMPDAIYLEDVQLGKMIDSGTVLPVQSCMEADGYDARQLLASARAAFSADGVLYPGYMNVSTPMLYYNKAHFEQAGLDPDVPPKTIDEMAEMARKIKDAGVAPTPISFKADEWFFNTWLAGAGEDAVNNENGRLKPATKANLTSETSVALLEQLQSLNEEGLMNAFPKTPGNIDHYLALVTESSSMLIETSTASSTIAEVLGGDIDTSDAGDAGIDVGAFDLSNIGIIPGSGPMPGVSLPGQVFASGGAFYMLNGGGEGGAAGDAKMAASWEFMKFMLQPANAKKWVTVGGYLPVVKAVAEDPEVQSFMRTNLQGILVRPGAEQLAGADPDRGRPLLGPYAKYTATLQGAMERVLLNGDDPTAALERADNEITKELENYNAD